MTPDKVVDVQALAGDPTDNVPGARGIGVKTAAQLINEYGSLDALLERGAEIKQPKRRETLTEKESVDLIRVSKQLVTLCADVPLECALDDLGWRTRREEAVGFPEGAGIHDDHTARGGIVRTSTPPRSSRRPISLGRGWRGRNGDALPESARSRATRRRRHRTGRRRPARQ